MLQVVEKGYARFLAPLATRRASGIFVPTTRITTTTTAAYPPPSTTVSNDAIHDAPHRSLHKKGGAERASKIGLQQQQQEELPLTSSLLQSKGTLPRSSSDPTFLSE